MWGVSEVTATYAAAFTLGVLDRPGRPGRGRGRALDAARGLPWVGEGGRLLRESRGPAAPRAGPAAEALDELTAPVDYPAVRQPGLGSVARAEGAGAGRARADRRGASRSREEEVALLRRWGAPTALGPALRLAAASCAGRRASADLREAVESCSPAPRASLEEARAQLALGACRGVADAEAVPLLRAALATARACGARRSSQRRGRRRSRQRGQPERRRGGRRPTRSPAASGGSPTWPRPGWTSTRSPSGCS